MIPIPAVALASSSAASGRLKLNPILPHRNSIKDKVSSKNVIKVTEYSKKDDEKIIQSETFFFTTENFATMACIGS